MLLGIYLGCKFNKATILNTFGLQDEPYSTQPPLCGYLKI